MTGPYAYPSDHWRAKVLYLSSGSKVAACVEAAEPHKTILFIDDEEIPANFPDLGSALAYADDLCIH